MSGDVLGGGIVVVIAAVLWLAYLVPNWMQRREYLATERNVVRLQQTLRILAETTEVPEEVRVEASAREVAVQRRAVREAERRQRADAWLQLRAARVANERPNASLALAARQAEARPSALQRRRRARALTSLVLLIGLVTAAAGAVAVAANGSWVLLATSSGLVVGALALLRRLARPGIAGSASAVAGVSAPLFDQAEFAVQDAPSSREWTPQPLPKPLHLSKGTVAAGAMASVDAAAELRRSLARARMELLAEERAALAAPERLPAARSIQLEQTARPQASNGNVASQPASSVPAREPSQYAGMGVVEEQQPANIDLNAALRRRRAV